jgi:hypothetical protein
MKYPPLLRQEDDSVDGNFNTLVPQHGSKGITFKAVIFVTAAATAFCGFAAAGYCYSAGSCRADSDDASGFLGVSAPRPSSLATCQVDISVIRHGEKGGEKYNLDDCGKKRAFQIKGKFLNLSQRPSLLFATNYMTSPYIRREFETLEPLGKSLHLPVNTQWSLSTQADFARYVLGNLDQWCGKSVVIAWEHCAIPSLLQMLGCAKGEEVCDMCWPDFDFETIAVLRYQVVPGGAPVVFTQQGQEGIGRLCEEDDRPVDPTQSYECAEKAQSYNTSTEELFLCSAARV